MKALCRKGSRWNRPNLVDKAVNTNNSVIRRQYPSKLPPSAAERHLGYGLRNQRMATEKFIFHLFSVLKLL